MIDYNGTPVSVEPTYMAAVTNVITVPASTKPFFVLMGSGTKTIRAIRIHITGPTLTTAEYNSIVLKKISSAPENGTITTLVKTPTDSVIPSSTASLCQMYTSAPSSDGTLIGTLQSQRVLLQNTSIGSSEQFTEILFDLRPPESSAGIVLRGTSEGITMSFGATPGSAVTLSLEAEWSETN